MRHSRLALAAIAGLTMVPWSFALAGSGPADLTKALADPVEANFVEISSNGSGDLVGYFDAGTYARWFGSDADSRNGLRDALTSRRFVTGYQREWYMPKSGDELWETVFVFRDRGGAASMLADDKRGYSVSQDFTSYVNVPFGEGSYGLEQIVRGYHWTIVSFTKGNDLFELSRGADSQFMTPAAISQAQEMFAVAPSGTALSPEPAQPSLLSRYLVPVVVTFAAGAVLIAVALAIAVAISIGRRSRPPAVPVNPGTGP